MNPETLTPLLLAVVGFFLVQIYFQLQKISATVSKMEGYNMVHEEKFRAIEKDSLDMQKEIEVFKKFMNKNPSI